MPGIAVAKAIKFTDVIYMDRENLELKFRVKPLHVRWVGMPVFQSEVEGTIQIRSSQEIQYTATYLGSWLVAANAWKHEWLIDFIDLDRGILAGNFSIAGGGLLNFGGGKGYQMVMGEGGTVREKPEVHVTATHEMQPPHLNYHVSFTDASGDGVIDEGEKVTVTVMVENNGQGEAEDVRVFLSGHAQLVSCLGEMKSLGNMQPGERKEAIFTTISPLIRKRETAEIKVSVGEGGGYSVPGTKTLKIAMKPGNKGGRETLEILSQLPKVIVSTQLIDKNNNHILESGEPVELRVALENKGDGVARQVQVTLSGHPLLVTHFGERYLVGDIQPGEKKVALFKALMPERVSTEMADLKIVVSAGEESSLVETRVLRMAMRAMETKETIETISEVSVDDIPPKVRDYDRRDNVALIVGISKYREKSIPEVKYAARDAEVMAKYLENVGGIPRQNIKILIDDKATKSDLEAHIGEWLSRRVTQRSTVFLYYAGHGAPGTQSSEAFIVPYEGHPDYPSQLYPLTKLYEDLNKLPAREIVVMLDSCFSGAKGRSITGEGTRPISIAIENPLLGGGKIVVLAASSGNQMSSDYDKGRHGLFTYYLLRGLRGEASRDKEGMVELGGLYEFVKKNVADTASLEMNRDQVPVLLPAVFATQEKLRLPIAKAR